MSGLQRGSQRGFIDERGNAPGDPQNAEERYPENAQEDIPMDQVNDESEPQQDAPAEPLDHLRSAENEDASHGVVNLIQRKSISGIITQLNLNLRLRDLMLKLTSTSRCSWPEERDQDNMNRIGRVRPRESDTS